MNTAPWPDFAGNALREGDTIRYPAWDGRLVVFLHSEPGPVDYGYGDLSRHCLQIGDKGQAVVAPATK